MSPYIGALSHGGCHLKFYPFSGWGGRLGKNILLNIRVWLIISLENTFFPPTRIFYNRSHFCNYRPFFTLKKLKIDQKSHFCKYQVWAFCENSFFGILAGTFASIALHVVLGWTRPWSWTSMLPAGHRPTAEGLLG